MAEVFTQPTEYLVSGVPFNDDRYPEQFSWTVAVAWCGGDRWAVRWRGQVFSRTGARKNPPEAVWEPIPSARSDHFKVVYRFPLDEALTIARDVATKVSVMGMTGAQYVALMDEEARRG